MSSVSPTSHIQSNSKGIHSSNPYVSEEIDGSSLNNLSFTGDELAGEVDAFDESNVDFEDPESLAQYIEHLQLKKELVEKEGTHLEKKQQEINSKIQNHEESSKNAFLQVETLGMMTKYQLVFVKMESAFAKVFNSNKLRDQKKAQSAFRKMRDNALSKRMTVGCQPEIIYGKLKKNVVSLLKIYQRQQLIRTNQAFSRWKVAIELDNARQKISKDMADQMKDASDSLKRKEKKLKHIEDDIQENEKQNTRLYNVVKDTKKLIEETEIQEEALAKEVNQLRSTRTRSTQGEIDKKITALEDQLATLQFTNREIKSETERTDFNIQNFISEMDTFLDANELSTTLEEISGDPSHHVMEDSRPTQPIRNVSSKQRKERRRR